MLNLQQAALVTCLKNGTEVIFGPSAVTIIKNNKPNQRSENFPLIPDSLPQGLFVDSEQGQLYYADRGRYLVARVDMKTKQETILLRLDNNEQPRAVVVDAARE